MRAAIVAAGLLSLPAWALTEWTMHKTPNGAHPNGHEQQMLWLMNRARQDPSAEGRWLANTNEAQIAYPRQFYDVDTSMLIRAFDQIPVRPPAAFDVRLYNAAYSHSVNLIQRDAQDHNGQIERVRAQNFNYTRFRGNVFSYADSAVNGHAAFNIDWGYGPGGMQNPAGHRMGIMGIDAQYANVGIAAVPERNTATAVGTLVITQNFAAASANQVDHFNAYVVGTVWEDLNGNGRYDPTEGVSGVTVTPNKGSYFAVTAAGGGYAIPVTATGSQQIRFSGGGITARSYVRSVSDSGLLLDHLISDDSAADSGGSDAVSQEPVSTTINLKLNQVNTGRYGRAFGSNRANASVSAQFDYQGKDLMFVATGFDIDTTRELEVKLNGNRIGYFLVSGNAQLRTGNVFSIPEGKQRRGVNTLTFISRDNQWGITNLVLRNVTGPTLNINNVATVRATNGFRWGDSRHRTVVRGTFNAASDTRHTLYAAAWNSPQPRTVAAYVNRRFVGFLQRGQANQLAPVTALPVSADIMVSGQNVVELRLLKRPGTKWGVTRLRMVDR